jgi:hypothetical protein
MNQFMQLGYCISPPFPKTEIFCNNTIVDHEKFYFEMHNFDYVDYAKHYSPISLAKEFKKRHERIKNCTKDWNPAELKMILKTTEEMEKTGGYS